MGMFERAACSRVRMTDVRRIAIIGRRYGDGPYSTRCGRSELIRIVAKSSYWTLVWFFNMLTTFKQTEICSIYQVRTSTRAASSPGRGLH